jgi:hypothetical protein
VDSVGQDVTLFDLIEPGGLVDRKLRVVSDVGLCVDDHLLQEAQVRISMAEVGAAWQNGYAERLIRTIKEDEVDLAEYQDYHDAHRQLGRFLDAVYAHQRIHSALGYLTPAEFEARWRSEQAQTLAH